MRLPIAVLAAVLLCSVACSQVPPPGAPGPGTITPTTPQTARADWQLALQPDATAIVTYRGAPLVKWHSVYWGANWKWAGAQLAVDGNRLKGAIPNLGLTVGGTVQKQAGGIVWHYQLTAAQAMPNVIGGGFEFNLRLNGPLDGAPELLPNKTGWEWQTPQGPIQVRFEPGLADCYFERGNKGTIRAYFVSQNITAGRHDVTMTLSLPAGGEVVKSAAERYGAADPANWPADLLAYDRSPVDLTALNDGPAGRHGFVQAKGDQLVFQDGTPVRFWGGNLAAYALFVDKPEIEAQAHRIAQLGYNLMRLHHHDSTRWVSPTVIDKNQPDSQHLDPTGMDRLDYWIYCLKREGVYVWLDLHVGRQFKAGDVDSAAGHLGGFDELERQHGEAKGFCYFNPTVQKLMQQFNQAYLTHVNPYTKLAYREEPAIMGLLLTNENDLTNHFGNLLLPDKQNPFHNHLFQQTLDRFVQQTGLPADKAWRTWEPGPSKIYLNEMEARFNRLMLAQLVDLGVKVPVATTQSWAGYHTFSLPALTTGGVLDVHSYGSAEFDRSNPRSDANWVSRIAGSAVAGMPLVITEWNVPYPATDRFTSPVAMLAAASLQGWDAPMIYNYSQDRFGQPDRAREWSTFYDPGLTALMPACALAFRQGHVQPAKETFQLQLDRANTYERSLSADTSATIRTLSEQSRIVIGLPDTPELQWDRETPLEPGAKRITDPDQDLLEAGAQQVVSDTGEIQRDWVLGVQTINTPLTQAAAGWLGGTTVALGDVTVQLSTPKAAVLVSALDGQPIASSRDILVTTVARVVATGGRMPYRSEPVTGELAIRAPAGLKLTALAPDGSAKADVPTSYADGVYRCTLQPETFSHWYRLR